MNKLLWYKKPTQEYMEGLPLGNGRIAAMALGTPEKFRLALNHEWMWRGENRFRDCDDMHEHLPEVRKLLMDGKFAEGTQRANDCFGGGGGLKGTKNRVDPYQPAGDVFVTMNPGNVSGYSRALDIATGLSTVEFDGDAGHVIQSVFVSASDGMVVMRIESAKRADLGVTLSRIADPLCQISYENRTVSGALEHETILRGAFKDGIKFAVALRITSDGKITPTENGYEVANASDTLLLVQIGTDAKGDAPDAELIFLNDANFGELFARHYAAFGALLGDTELDIPLADSEKPTDERVSDFRAGGDPQIPLLYYEYGRYLMASGSSAELPLNLQGKWNDMLNPPWECDYHLDINLEMCYWFTETLGMEHAENTLFNLAERYVPHGREMARKLYGCDGICFTIQTDVWGRMTPESYGWSVWIGGAAWIAQHFYDHWLYTRDEKFLRERCYPFIKDVAEFYNDYIIERDGRLYIVPSQSPENSFVGNHERMVSLFANSAMDLEFAHSILREAAELAGVLGEDAESARKWRELDESLPQPGIDSKGRIIEFDVEREEAEPGHRHVSHLIGLHPLRMFEKDSEMWNAAEKSLDSRLANGGGHTGWSRSWVSCMMARLGRPDDAWEHFIALIADFATVSLLDLHPPRIFQIDGNMGGTAAVCEMLMHSRERDLYILPALPKQWPEGSVKNFRAMSDCRVSFEWDNGEVKKLVLTCGARATGALTVHVGDENYAIKLKPGEIFNII